MFLAGLVVAAIGLATVGPLLARRRQVGREASSRSGTPCVEFSDPKELLFSVPTLNDGIPAVETQATFAREANAALFHEDDWRQEEFTPVANREFVQGMLALLARHRAVHAAGSGFREVLVRAEPPMRLEAIHLALDEVRAVLDAPAIPLYLNGSRPCRVLGGFAVRLADVGYVYGQSVEGIVSALGVGLVGSGLGDVGGLAELSERNGLLFVDWVRGVVIEPGDAIGFRRWLDAIIYRDPDPAR